MGLKLYNVPPTEKPFMAHLALTKDFLQLPAIAAKCYSGTPLNRYPSTADTHDVADNYESPDHFFIDFSPPE